MWYRVFCDKIYYFITFSKKGGAYLIHFRPKKLNDFRRGSIKFALNFLLKVIANRTTIK